MRTTLDLNDSLLVQAKSRAAREHRTLTSLVEEALRKLLDGGHAKPKKVPVIPVIHGGRVMPGVDLTSNAAMQDLLDEDDHGIPRR